MNIFTGLQYSSRDDIMLSLLPSRHPDDPGTPDHIHRSGCIQALSYRCSSTMNKILKSHIRGQGRWIPRVIMSHCLVPEVITGLANSPRRSGTVDTPCPSVLQCILLSRLSVPSMPSMRASNDLR